MVKEWKNYGLYLKRIFWMSKEMCYYDDQKKKNEKLIMYNSGNVIITCFSSRLCIVQVICFKAAIFG